ncbi:16S ribosomal RNA methyltransferase KsgA/Dim1 family protein [Thalassovita gelatinovora]|uniref:16S ribosomal RNA methyltransferase KsgA/Dim1 family protein n=1 Tax=Thalassovita gelatinovora TaxID=53501 RepID=A0A0P1FLP9_THAGE|nr:rRNA adenine N-6-methyltransferase family protein [Thalassovita gelatinovora]QIZ79123.1 methyltransferase type 12 [Thalassovita gelatinovora]CUH68783.1 16S ribosomal RNA methyltransferase KsgA/Dim1 family protein [Thalassovita gelatinovora]SEQ58662.1 phosphatidylethanolamine/phosphatidyl-N-methylethanolamine N-methyltransferase [Thalassovita gelatinovora]
MASDFAVFLGEMIRRPTEVVAIAPSSAAVARRMTEGVEQVQGPIVEIGPGTGSFTRAILDRGVAPERLTLMEMNPRFCETLREKFPGVTVLNRPAQDIERIGLRDIGAVISGVPVLARPQIQRDVVGRAFRVMARDGFFTQITYSANAPISPDMQAELGLRADKRATVWANLPPARVFSFYRASH